MIDLNKPTQSLHMACNIRKSLYDNLKGKGHWVRPIGAIIGTVSSLVGIISVVAQIVESLFKAIATISCCLFFKECTLKHGLTHLKNSLIGTFIYIPSSLFYSIYTICQDTVMIAFKPEEFAINKSYGYWIQTAFLNERFNEARDCQDPFFNISVPHGRGLIL